GPALARRTRAHVRFADADVARGRRDSDRHCLAGGAVAAGRLTGRRCDVPASPPADLAHQTIRSPRAPGVSRRPRRGHRAAAAGPARALFAFPFADMKGAHGKWLVEKKAALKRQFAGARYFDEILDRMGIETSMANRVAMADYLDPARFKWVFFVDCLMFPFDNSALAARNTDEAVYMPLQTKLLRE